MRHSNGRFHTNMFVDSGLSVKRYPMRIRRASEVTGGLSGRDTGGPAHFLPIDDAVAQL